MYILYKYIFKIVFIFYIFKRLVKKYQRGVTQNSTLTVTYEFVTCYVIIIYLVR